MLSKILLYLLNDDREQSITEMVDGCGITPGYITSYLAHKTDFLERIDIATYRLTASGRAKATEIKDRHERILMLSLR